MLIHKNLIKFLSYSYSRDIKAIPEQWNILLDAKQLGQDLAGYDAVAFVNNASNLIIVANNGTILNISDLKNLYQDLSMWFDIYKQEIPYQFLHGGIKFLDNLKEKMVSEQLQEYKVINIGHSTGSINSDLATLYLNNSNIKAISTTYENPGSKPILEKYAELKDIDLENIRGNFQVFNAQESIFNELNSQFGSVIRIDPPHGPDNSILAKTAFTLNKIGEALGFAYKAYSLFTNFKYQIQNHTLEDDQIINTYHIGGTNVVQALSTGLMVAGVKMIEFEKAAFNHKFENIKRSIDEDYIPTNNEFNMDGSISFDLSIN